MLAAHQLKHVTTYSHSCHKPQAIVLSSVALVIDFGVHLTALVTQTCIYIKIL
jgi:hypothetical protein